MEGQNLADAAVKYKYWLAAEKVDGDIGGTTQEVVLTDTIQISTDKLKAGSYRVFLQALDAQNTVVVATSYSTIDYAPPSFTDKLTLRFKALAANAALVSLMTVMVIGLLIVVLWLVAPRGTLGRSKRVDLVLQESSRKGRPSPPPAPAPRPQPAASASRSQPPAPVQRPPAPPASAPRPPAASRSEPTPTVLMDAPRGPLQGRLVVQHLPVGLQVPAVTDITKMPFTLGRVNGDLTVSDARVSRRHAVISYEQGAFYIQDAASANGTLINGVKIAPDKKAPLASGTVIGLGPEILFKFEIVASS